MNEFGHNNPQSFGEEEVEGNYTEKLNLNEDWTIDPEKRDKVLDYVKEGKLDNYEFTRVVQTLTAKIKELENELKNNDSDEVRNLLAASKDALESIS